MNVNFVLLLFIALIFAAGTKVDGEAEVVTNSNLTDSRSGGSVIVADHSKSDTELGDGSKPKAIEEDVSKIEGKGASDESKDIKEEAKSNNSPRKKEGFHGEECDPSNMCTDEQGQFVACLQVPGNDAPHLSLLIQNKGKDALIVSITAPGFVRLDKYKVHLLENENTKVKVYSIKNKKG